MTVRIKASLARAVLLSTFALVHCSRPTFSELSREYCRRTCTAGGACEPADCATVVAAPSASGGGGGGGRSDAGGAPSASTGAAGSPGSGSEGPDIVDACTHKVLGVVGVVPTVVLLIDRSASMSARQLDPGSPGVSRWDALKRALLSPGGVIAELQDEVRFGVVFYAGGGSSCPVLDQGGQADPLMPPRKSLLTALNTHLQPLGTLPDSPTGESVARVAADLAAFTEPGPKFIVLATDGEPDLCANRREPSGRERSVEEVAKAYQAGIKTFVVGVGTDVAESHLAQVANAGQGFAATDVPSAPRFDQVTTQGSMADAFERAVAKTRSCTFSLSEDVDPTLAVRGELLMNGMPLPASDTNGWRVIDGRTIELVGNACETSRAGHHDFFAVLPCEAVLAGNP